jgi:peptide/nickel transport system permease protein
MTDATSAPPKPASQSREIWQQFRTHKGALFGLIVLAS